MIIYIYVEKLKNCLRIVSKGEFSICLPLKEATGVFIIILKRLVRKQYFVLHTFELELTTIFEIHL